MPHLVTEVQNVCRQNRRMTIFNLLTHISYLFYCPVSLSPFVSLSTFCTVQFRLPVIVSQSTCCIVVHILHRSQLLNSSSTFCLVIDFRSLYRNRLAVSFSVHIFISSSTFYTVIDFLLSHRLPVSASQSTLCIVIDFWPVNRYHLAASWSIRLRDTIQFAENSTNNQQDLKADVSLFADTQPKPLRHTCVLRGFDHKCHAASSKLEHRSIQEFECAISLQPGLPEQCHRSQRRF